jgi:glycine/D-amino acid oxidase-like deaminating enzyme
MTIKLESKIPPGPLAEKWEYAKSHYKLVNPANRRKFDVIVVGAGLAGGAAAATLGELGYNVKCFVYHDSPRRAHSIAAQGGINAAKNYRNASLNPNAYRRQPLSEETILESRMLNHPLTQYMFCSPDEGAAAVVLCRADHAQPVDDRRVAEVDHAHAGLDDGLVDAIERQRVLRHARIVETQRAEP